MDIEKDRATAKKWLSDHNIKDVEIIVCDFAGLSRGKIMPADKFIGALGGRDLRMPDSVFSMTLDCDFIINDFMTDMAGNPVVPIQNSASFIASDFIPAI